MAHSDIYTKYMIEYDKANVTSSYPSFTKTEIAVILNKAYLALIAQKITGNNPRQAPFEADSKAISDIQPLLVTTSLAPTSVHSTAQNSMCYTLPQNFLYYVSGNVTLQTGKDSPVLLVSHETAQRFKQSISNRPWIKNAVVYVEGNQVVLLYDNYAHNKDGQRTAGQFKLTYVKEPSKFTNAFDGTFELNDTMAEELISLAVLMSLENVESQRLTTKVQTRGLEA